MSGTAFQPAFLSAALWVAVAGFHRRLPESRSGVRHLLGLALGALAAHLGWAVLHADRVLARPEVLLDPTSGFCVLFVPLGPLAVAPWRGAAAARAEFLTAALGALPLALAVARLGCLAAGCCHGVPAAASWIATAPGSGPPHHPTALYETLGLAALHALAAWLPRAAVAPTVLVAVGALRLAIEPFRAAPPLGATLVPIAWLAGGWIAAGLGLAIASGAHPSWPSRRWAASKSASGPQAPASGE